MVKVFKFGGASIKNAEAIHNIQRVLKGYARKNLIIVISAMAKTTNALEELALAYYHKGSWQPHYQRIQEFHHEVLNELFMNANDLVNKAVGDLFEGLFDKLSLEPSLNFNFEYDQIVSFGELLSTTIISYYLNANGISNQWIDARKLIRTDSNFREADIQWDLSASLFHKKVDFKNSNMYITQGFIGADKNNSTTTLGREGSDFTAAAIAFMMDAASVTVWKDVPGVLNADPKYFKDTIKLDHISYLDAIELAYFGTSVIHPKTIQPLQQKGIALYVKSFMEPSLGGTVVSNLGSETKIPCFIIKHDQRLIHISTRDFSFILEKHLKEIFRVFARYGLRVNIMQNSAISFDVCVGNDVTRVPAVISELENDYNISDEADLDLITIRHYNDEIVSKMLKKRELVLQQSSKENIQLVTRDKE